MLSRSQIEQVAQTLTHGNAGHAETLYLQDIVLSTLSRETADQLVFKGGTALLKFYQLDRFSDDLDFTARRSIEFEGLLNTVERDLENYGASVEERTVEAGNTSLSARFGIQGPLYTGTRRSLCFLRIEVNTESSIRHVDLHRYTPPFSDIPSYDLSVLNEAEILAEKLRALMTRRQPRDLYDIYHLLSKSVSVDRSLVQVKFGYYDVSYDPVDVIERARLLKDRWTSFEPLIYSELPAFAEVIELLEQELDRSSERESDS